MAVQLNEIKTSIRDYVVQHFLKHKKAEEISDTTPLIGSGLLDSISTMQLVVHIEKTFHIEFEAHEVDKDNFANIDTIAAFISQKL